MKTLAFTVITLLAMNAMAVGNSNVSCNGIPNKGRESIECSSSLLSDATKLALNCASQVKEKNNKKTGAVD